MFRFYKNLLSQLVAVYPSEIYTLAVFVLLFDKHSADIECMCSLHLNADLTPVPDCAGSPKENQDSDEQSLQEESEHSARRK